MTLWTLQGWVSMFFIAAGYAKLTEPMNNLVVLLGWPEKWDPAAVRIFGALEIVLAMGLLVPLISWIGGRQVLLVSSACLLVLQVFAVVQDIYNGHIAFAIINVILIILTLTIFRGRMKYGRLYS